MIFFDNIVVNILLIIQALIVSAIIFLKYRFRYWKNLGVPYIEPKIPFGNMKKIIFKKLTYAEQFKEMYDKLKSQKHQHGGVFLGPRPIYMPIDNNIIKSIMQTDFQHFRNHGVYFDEENDPLSGHLFSLEDVKWKNMRSKLTPTFTSGKIKTMFQTLSNCTIGIETIMENAASSKEPLDIKDVLARFSTDVIASAAFGIECNSFSNPDAEFRKYGKLVFDINAREQFKLILQSIFPFWFLRLIKFKQINKKVTKYFIKLVTDVVNYREENNIYRKDVMHMLIQLKNRGEISDDRNLGKNIDREDNENNSRLSITQLAGIAYTFYLGGFETSSSAITFALYELAQNPEIQKKLRDEINTVLAQHDNKFTYEAIKDMTYIEKVIYETLRKYPPVPLLLRQCTEEYTIPGTNIKIRKGVHVGIPNLGIHHDPQYYPEPQKFDPERFSEENKRKRLPCTYLPFGEGPRTCIGVRFGVLQIKMGLTALLRNYEVRLNKKTQLPLQMDKNSFVLSVCGGIWIDVKKIH